MLIMYTSAIFYSIDIVSDQYLWIFNLNPLYHAIVNFRNAVFGQPLNQEALLISALYSFGSLLIGTLLFYKKQDKFILNI